jgi:hypothetical protein
MYIKIILVIIIVVIIIIKSAVNLEPSRSQWNRSWNRACVAAICTTLTIQAAAR